MLNRPLDVLERLVATLNQYNESDMLDGYLDDLAAMYNKDLGLLGLPTINIIGTGNYVYSSEYLESLDRVELLSLMLEHGYEAGYEDLDDGALRDQLSTVVGDETE